MKKTIQKIWISKPFYLRNKRNKRFDIKYVGPAIIEKIKREDIFFYKTYPYKITFPCLVQIVYNFESKNIQSEYKKNSMRLTKEEYKEIMKEAKKL